jgi:hypothetical protein
MSEEIEFEDRIGLSFEDFKITTMTAYFPNKSGSIKLSPLFYLIHWADVELKLPLNHRSKKIKIIDDVPKGAITSIRYKSETRGLERIVRKDSKSHFQNAISMDVGTGNKSVCLKLSNKSIHIVGAKSVEMCKIASDIIMKEVKRINTFMKNYEKYRKDIDLFLKAVKGEKRKMQKTVGKFTVIFEDYLINDTSSKFEKINKEVADFFFPLLKEYIHYQQFERLIQSLDKERFICSEDFAMEEEPEIGMINYNYNLPFQVNRKAIDQLMQDRYGFHTRFDNTQDSAVYVELPYESNKKKKGKNTHTFMVRKSGSVTQTGPNIELMHEAFLLFVMALSEIKDEIISET